MHLVAATTRDSAPVGRYARTAGLALTVFAGVLVTLGPKGWVENVVFGGAALAVAATGLCVWGAWRLRWGRQVFSCLRERWKLIRAVKTDDGYVRRNCGRRAD